MDNIKIMVSDLTGEAYICRVNKKGEAIEKRAMTDIEKRLVMRSLSRCRNIEEPPLTSRNVATRDGSEPTN